MRKFKHLPWALRFVINSVIIIAFIAALFFSGIAIYGAAVGMTFIEAWGAFITACKGAHA